MKKVLTFLILLVPKKCFGKAIKEKIIKFPLFVPKAGSLAPFVMPSWRVEVPPLII